MLYKLALKRCPGWEIPQRVGQVLIWERTEFWCWELMALILWGRHFGKLMAETFVQPLGDCVASSQGASGEGMHSVSQRTSKGDSFQWRDSCAPRLGISSQPALLVCSAQKGQPGGDIKASAMLHSLLDIWDPRSGMGEHRVHPWPQVLSSLLYLHYWSPTKIEASFHQHQAKQDNTYLNFIYSLNRQDRQRVAVETKALERWCDMTRSHSRRLRDPGTDRGFLTPSPNDLSIGAR